VLNGPGVPEETERLRAAIESHSVACLYSPADIGNPDEVGQMMRDVQAKLGSVDILVNNAVVRHFHPIEEFSAAEWERALAVNVSGAFHTIRLALPGMKKRNWGRIINLASIYSTRGCENRVDYVTAKHAIVGITRTVALEVARSGITCNALQPGWVLTPHSERQIAEEMARAGRPREEAIETLMGTRQPSHRFVMPEEVAAFAVFLCSDVAASVNGALLPIDSGWSAAP
jgi:3-hydroxybutyrate dehydrogenase